MLCLQLHTLLGLTVVALLANAVEATPLYHYVVIGPNGSQSARAIVNGDSACPRIRMRFEQNGKTASAIHPMRIRAEPDQRYPVRVCEYDIPSSGVVDCVELVAEDDSALGTAFPLLTYDIDRVYMMGDTGCRLDHTHTPQACSSSTEWPFEMIVSTITNDKNGVIVHLGDYVYRDKPCPQHAQHLCGGSPYGDGFAAWEADFFKPADAALKSRPFIFIRGNHEDCKRPAGSKGFFRFLHWGPNTEKCIQYTDAFTVPLKSWTLLVMDTSIATVEHPKDAMVENFEEMVSTFASHFHQLFNDATLRFGTPALLLTHRPIHGFRARNSHGGAVSEDYTLQTALSRVLEHPSTPRCIRACIAGHTHLMQAIFYGKQHGRRRSRVLTASIADEQQPWRPLQLYVGNSGTSLAVPVPHNDLMNEAPLIDGFSIATHGFAVLFPNMEVVFHAVDGRVLEKIHLQ